MNRAIKKALPIVLSVFGSIGVVGTSILAVKDSKKCLNEKKSFKSFIKNFWPSILSGAATIGSITAGTILSKKTEASLSAAVIMLERGYNKYQGKVKECFGMDAHKNILESIAKDETKKLGLAPETKDGRKLYYNTYIGHFYATQENVNRAILNMNMRLHCSGVNTLVPWPEKGICTIKQFVEEAGAEILDLGVYDAYKDFGWTYEYLSDVCEDEWIYDGYNEKKEADEEVITLVFMTVDPIYIPDGWNHDEYLLRRSEKWHGRLIEDDPQSDEIPFNMSEEDWLKQASHEFDLSDEEEKSI